MISSLGGFVSKIQKRALNFKEVLRPVVPVPTGWPLEVDDKMVTNNKVETLTFAGGLPVVQ